ncbi:MAG: T9SS type A sorting domain-containing protein [Bacteroidetes bacterium]|nr:T9SS type A sorting domain-containing protein [Bacteroidota bacterium]
MTFLLLSVLINAQDFQKDFDAIIESEARTTSQLLNFRININTENYDLKYHRLELTVNPNVASISGDITSHFEAKESMTEITFDLKNNMIVSQVMQRGSSLSFTQNANHELVITLPQTLNQGVLDSLTVSYSGTPIVSGFDSFEQSTHNGDPIIWTLSEPYGAKDWWPCKQDLNDKIDKIDVYITTPQFNPSAEEYFAVSNGLELSQVVNGSDKTTHFKHQFPIPAYLIAFAVTNYEVYSHTVANNGNPFDIVNYVYPESLVSAQASTGVTVDIMDLFTNLFEEYPFAAEKYGHAQFGWGGGMEHTTVSFMGSFGRNLIAHELAHQWFGDKITCGSWKDIWLNEGFATYLSGLVIEDFDGNSAFTTWKQQRTNNITSQTGGSVYLTDADTTNVSRIFDGRLTYNKGAMVLHMLRKKLGDTNFFQGIKNYLSDVNLAYSYAKTVDFVPIMEAVSGESLTEFFNDWLYNQGYPSYTIEWNQPNVNQVRFIVNQVQSHGSVTFFEAPVPLRIHGTGGEILDVVLDNTSNGQEFFKAVAFAVSSVEFDPEADLISKNNSITLSLNGILPDKKFSIYPNPASALIYIQKPIDTKIYSFKIFNIIGQLVKSQDYRGAINITQLSSGLHFIRFETNQGVIHKSLLKQ